MSPENFTFDSYASALLAPAPDPLSKSKAFEYWHPAVKGFGLRVGRQRQDGVVKRSYIARPNAKAVAAGAPPKPVLGLAVACDGVPGISFANAMEAALRLVNNARIQSVMGYSSSTLGEIYACVDDFFKSPAAPAKIADSYIKTIRDMYKRFLSSLHDRNIEELDEPFWHSHIEKCRDGKFKASNGKFYNAAAVSVQRQILNAASYIIRFGHKLKMVGAKSKTWNPTLAILPECGKPNEREEYVDMSVLRATWRAADQLLAPWWRDLFKVFLLTGLRDKLLSELKWSQVDLANGWLKFEPTAAGAKRHRKAMSENDRKKLIVIPISSEVIRILRNRLEFNPTDNTDDYVWYSPPSIRKKTKDGTPCRALSDPRSAWANLEPHAGFTPKKHDLRRTFASVGGAVLPEMVTDKKSPHLSMLMMHSTQTIADFSGLSPMTVRYIKGQIEPMRIATERITQAVLEIAGELTESPLTRGLDKLQAPQETLIKLRNESRALRESEEAADDDITDIELID